VNQHIFRVDFSPDDFEPEFLKLALTANLATYIDQAQGGVGLAHITKAKLNDSTLLAPPLDVQRAVVALLGDIEIGVTAARTQIAAATRSVERFRAAVLAAACSGRLTADWREAHPDLRAAEITPSSAVVLPLFDAPENWQWSSLDSITDIRGGIQVGAKTRDGANLREVPYLRVANVQRGWLDLSEVKKIAAPEDKIAALRLQPGDIFFNEGGDRDKLGRGWIWEGQIDECIHQNHVFRARLHNPAFEPRFYSWFGNSFGTRYFIDEGKQTVNLASLSKKRLERLPVPVPPPEEQSEIVRRVDALLAIADRLTSQVEGIAATVARVSGATLAKALRGELISTEASLAAEPRRGFGSPQKLVEHVEATRESSSHTSRRRAKA
jgi:type I restriction enzyme S subunit